MGRISTTAALTIAGVLAAGTATALVNAHILASGLDGSTPTNPVELATPALVEAPPLASPTPPQTAAPVTDATAASSPSSVPPATGEVVVNPPTGDSSDAADAPVASDATPGDHDAGLATDRGGARPDRTVTPTSRPATTVPAPPTTTLPPPTTVPASTTTAPRSVRPPTTTTTPRPTTSTSSNTTFPPDD